MKRLALTLIALTLVACFSLSVVADEAVQKKKADKAEQSQKDSAKKDNAQKEGNKDAQKEKEKNDAKKDEAVKKEQKQEQKQEGDKKKDGKKAAPEKKATEKKPDPKDAKKEAAKKKPAKEKTEPKKAPAKDAKKEEAKKEESGEKEKSDKEDAKKEEPKKEEPKTVEVKTDEVHLSVDLKGVFEARKSVPIKLEPEQWSSFKILSIAKHGQKVHRGELLVLFDPEKIDKAIANGRRSLAMARLSFQKAEKEFATFQKLLPIKQKIIARADKELREDQEWKDTHDRKMIKEDLEIFYKTAKFRVDSAREEYKQLKKLYEADELTEETEELILKRTKLEMEQAEYLFKYYQSEYEFAKKYGLDRFEKTYEENKLREQLQNEEQIAIFPLSVELKKIAMEKERLEFEEAKEEFEELQADRKLMMIKAPCDGVVYYGYCHDGKWGGATSSMLEKGKAIPAKKTFMTIVRSDSLRVRSSVSEKDFSLLCEGTKATARATILPETQLQLLVDEVSEVPSSGSFDVILKLIGKAPEQIMPGMSCAIRVIGYHKEDALVIPRTAIEDDPLDDSKHFVYRVDKEGKSKKVKIRKGKTFGKNVEVLDGLKVGDKILPEPPEEDEKE